MKKTLLFAGLLILAFQSQFSLAAVVKGKLTKIDSNSAKIVVSDSETNQAAHFSDTAELVEFLEMQRSDPMSLISILEKKTSAEAGVCSALTPDSECGWPGINYSKPVTMDYGRGGWASAMSTVRIFMGYFFPGTSQATIAFYSVDINVEINPADGNDGQEGGKFIKTYKVAGAQHLTDGDGSPNPNYDIKP